MICPKCRKIYPDGIDACPECGSQLIALMGEADAPIDRNNDNISSIDKVFKKSTADAQESKTAYDAQIHLDADEQSRDFDENTLDSEDGEAFEDDGAFVSEDGFSLSYPDDGEELDYRDEYDGIKLFTPSSDNGEDFYPDGEQEQELYDEEYGADFDGDGTAPDGEYYEEDYPEDSEDYEDGAEYYGERENAEPDNAGAMKARLYKPFQDEEAAQKELRDKKNMNMLTALIFTAAVVLIIASVVCFVLGNTTELTEMNIGNIFLGFSGLVK